MSDQSESRKRLILAVLLLAAAGGVLAWSLTRKPQAVDDQTAQKVDELKSILDDAMTERAATEEAPATPEPVDGPTNMRSRDSDG
jgi:hypothetical protein